MTQQLPFSVRSSDFDNTCVDGSVALAADPTVCAISLFGSASDEAAVDLLSLGVVALVGLEANVVRTKSAWTTEIALQLGQGAVVHIPQLNAPSGANGARTIPLNVHGLADFFDFQSGSAYVAIINPSESDDVRLLDQCISLAESEPCFGLVIIGCHQRARALVLANASNQPNSVFHQTALLPAPARLDLIEHEIPVHPQNPDIQVNVLGNIEILNTEGKLTHRPKLTELVVYLAMHNKGATTRSWSAALWPERRVPQQTIANRLSEARRALGIANDQKPRLRRNGDRHFIAGLESDWSAFQRITAIGTDPRSWREALELVRGRPFEGLHQGEWTAVEGFATEIEQRILKCALAYGNCCLEDDRPEEAAWSAQVGLRANPWEEELHRLLMRAADASGNRAGINHALRHLALVMEIDGDPLDGVHPQTAALYSQLVGTEAR